MIEIALPLNPYFISLVFVIQYSGFCLLTAC